jgi:hypothetical protein
LAGFEPTSGGRKKKEKYRRKRKVYEEEVEWFRQEIRRPMEARPRVLDPSPPSLEAMRLGCEVTAVDINPWPGSFPSARSNTRRGWPARPLPYRTSFSKTRSSWIFIRYPHFVGQTTRTKKQAKEFRNDSS